MFRVEAVVELPDAKVGDGEETTETNTDPLNSDTDGVGDGAEVEQGTPPDEPFVLSGGGAVGCSGTGSAGVWWLVMLVACVRTICLVCARS